MTTTYCLLTLLSLGSVCFAQQRIAPGVPPQHYQQQHQQPPQYQQQQVHHQQQQQHQQHIPQQHVPPLQQQQQHQVPVQQHQQQVPVQHQQVPVQHGHGHHHPPPGQILNAGNVMNEKEHIQEHMEVPIDTSKMSEQELQFHYFKMHDADNNNKLDGCELIKSLIHWHDDGVNEVKERVLNDTELQEIVDPLFQSIDTNNDGYVDYIEFRVYTT